MTEREIKCLLKENFLFTVTYFYPSLRAAFLSFTSLLACVLQLLLKALNTTKKFVCSALYLFVALTHPAPSPSKSKFFLFLCFAHLPYSRVKPWPVPFCLSSHHAVAFFPWRYMTFFREQGPVILRLTTDPLPGSSLASHTLNSHFPDTWAIRLSANITDT